MLQPIDEGIWVAWRPVGRLGTRMTVIRLPDGNLLLHSPVEADFPTRGAVEGQGRVRYVVAPNRFHHRFVKHWLEHCLGSEAYAAPGLPEKRKDLKFAGTLGRDPLPAWSAVLDQTLIEGAPALGEVVFLHKPSRTLILADLAFNFHKVDSFLLRLYLKWNGAYGRLANTSVTRSTFKDKSKVRESMKRVLDWDFDRIILAHGDVVESGGKDALAKLYLPGKKS